MSDAAHRAAVAVESADSFLAARAAMASMRFANAWGKDGLTWWRDVRAQADMLGGREVSDALLVQVKAWLADNVRVPAGNGGGSKALVASVRVLDEVATLLAHANPRDAVAEYLEALPAWDGTPRIVGGLADAMGFATYDAELAYAERQWLRRWCIAAVARALRPGCQSDSALVLVGGQGLGKSSAIKALFGDAHVYDSSLDMESKDGASVMSRAWCVELAELASMRRTRDVEAVKHFLTLREDSYRPAYGRRLVTQPRRCVVAGTTNDASPLTDPTGNRRFWPTRVARVVALEWIVEHRDALWAEAKAAYEAREQWHLTAEESEAHVLAASAYTQSDEWVELLRTWVESVGEEELVRLSAAAQILGLEDRHLDQGTQRRLATCLRLLGLEQRHTREGKRWRKVLA